MRFVPTFLPIPLGLTTAGWAKDPVRALIVDGRNNHDWSSTTDHLHATRKATGRFDVTVSTAPQLRFPKVPRKFKRPEDEAALKEARKLFEVLQIGDRSARGRRSGAFSAA